MWRYLRMAEEAFCVCTIIGALYWLITNGIASSKQRCDELAPFKKVLKGAWIPTSYGIDLTDVQWRSWREQAPLLIPLLVGCVFIRRRLVPPESGEKWKRATFTAYWGIAFAAGMHGSGMVWLTAALAVNFVVSRKLGADPRAVAWAWVFNLLLLGAAKVWGEEYWEELLSDWGFGFIASSPSFKRLFGLSLLDQIYNGVYEWTRPLNLTVLRLISFNIEAHQAAKRHESSTPMQEQGGGDKNKTEKGKEDAEDTLAREAVLKDWIDLPPDRAFLSYLAYILYPPLYVAGPIITFDDFLRQIVAPPPQNSAGPSQVTAGFFKLLRASASFLLLEVMLHFLYYHAVSLNLPRLLHTFPKHQVFIPPWEMMFLGFYMLNYMYLKFLTIWRATAAVAFLDGVTTTDNMNRCVCNNYTFGGFWRSWHRSLHVWILRYLYGPLGGHARRLVVVWPIFVFIGLWHDLELRWLAWALLNCFCICLEGFSLAYFRGPSCHALRQTWWWDRLCILGGVLNVYLLMVCNLAILYGFNGSYDYLCSFLLPYPGYSTWSDIVTANLIGFWWLCCGVTLMMRTRERERESGKLKRF